jgi:NodT family efflux transporter outer membrane factor (OMF) lipoprotein
MTSISEYFHNGFKVGPNYHAPPVPLPKKWIDDADPHVQIGTPNLATWWEVFGDPTLADLIQKCYSSNLTLRAAGFQILAAREQRRIAISELLPQTQNGTFTYTRFEVSGTGGIAAGASPFFGTTLTPTAALVPVAAPSTPIAGVVDPGMGTTSTATSTGSASTGTPSGGSGGASRFFDNWATNLNASWELDFWGLFRRNIEAANAALDQSVFNSDQMAVLLLANVATQYVEIRTLQRRLELARKNVALQEPLVSQLEARFKASMPNSSPGYHQLLSNLENTKALIPQLEITLRDANNQLCNLIGIPVQDLQPTLGDGTVADAKTPSKREVHIPRPLDYSVVVDIPANYLLQRPDVRSAEEQLRIQSAQIGISEAELYPHIGINGSIGLAAPQFRQLFDSRAGTGSIGPSLTWNILQYGRLLANVRLQNHVYQQFVAEYQQAILNANQDAENALTAYLKSIDQAQHLKASADAAAELTDYLIAQFKKGHLPPGAADTGAFINQLFTAINFQVTQQDAAAQAEGNVALNLILLYRAMGGGWQLRLTEGKCPGSMPAVDTWNSGAACPHAINVGPAVFGSLPVAPSATPAEPLPPPRMVPATNVGPAVSGSLPAAPPVMPSEPLPLPRVVPSLPANTNRNDTGVPPLSNMREKIANS